MPCPGDFNSGYSARNPGADNLSLCDWLDHYRIPYLYILAKTNKLSNNHAIARKRAIEKTLHVSAEKKPILFRQKHKRAKKKYGNSLKII